MAAKKAKAKVPAPKKRRPIAYDPNSARAIAFCERYSVHLRPTDAAKEAGYSAKRAKVTACELLQLPAIQARIQTLLEAKSKRTAIEADTVINRLWAIATADPRELVEHRVGACRHCHGVSHQYQRTQAEREKERAAWTKLSATEKLTHALSTVTGEFDEKGGAGYVRTRPPHPDCPECAGLGEGFTVVKDQRALSAAALQLLAGVKETREGVDVKMHDQVTALLQVGRHLKLFTDVVQHDTTPGLADALKAARERAAQR